MSDVEEHVDNVSDGGDDLFGDDADDASQIEDNPPIPSDDESDHVRRRRRSASRDSASQQDARSQIEPSIEPEVTQATKSVVEEYLQRHGLPKTKDGNMQLAKVPNFLRFIPEPYDADTPPSSWEIENSKRRIPINLVRYRRNPETGALESNANIYRWSDGSLTIQVGEEHYDIQVKPQIPPARKAYQPDRDANRYIAAAHAGQGQLLTVAHVTEEWAIRPDKQRVDEDTELLREKMGLAKGGTREGEMIITTNQDPELQKKQAELAEKERARAQRKRENAQMRSDGGVGGGYRKGGLSIVDLEGGRRTTSGRKRGPGGSSKRQRTRNDDSDSDMDRYHGNNEYDKGDDFIVGSDEEESLEGDDDILDDGDEDYGSRAKRQRTREPSDEADSDADGEPDDDAPAASADHGRRRVRRVVQEDDDDDE